MTSEQAKTEALNLVVTLVEAVQSGKSSAVSERVVEFDRLLDRLIASAKLEQAKADLATMLKEGGGHA